jgi:TonB family protein
MFRSERLKAALSGDDRRRMPHLGGGLPAFLLEESDSQRRRPFKLGVAIAVAAHLALFVIVFPRREPEPREISRQQVHYVVQQVRFEPPAPRPQTERPQPKEKRRVIPVPDPTPDDPEPIVMAEITAPDIDSLVDLDGLLGIPEAPPDGRAGALALAGNIQAPVKVFSPQPTYTEDARRAGIQGVVILEAVVDADGTVRNVKVLKGLPMGLDKSAVETVMTWRYEPATMEGKPVPVYFTFTISFSLT